MTTSALIGSITGQGQGPGPAFQRLKRRIYAFFRFGIFTNFSWILTLFSGLMPRIRFRHSSLAERNPPYFLMSYFFRSDLLIKESHTQWLSQLLERGVLYDKKKTMEYRPLPGVVV